MWFLLYFSFSLLFGWDFHFQFALLFVQIAPFDPTKKKKKKKPVVQDGGGDCTDKLAENIENLSSKFDMTCKLLFLFVCICLHNHLSYLPV